MVLPMTMSSVNVPFNNNDIHTSANYSNMSNQTLFGASQPQPPSSLFNFNNVNKMGVNNGFNSTSYNNRLFWTKIKKEKDNFPITKSLLRS